MNDEQEAGRGLDALAFGLGARRAAPKDPYEVLTSDQPKKGARPRGSTITQQYVKQGLGGCSCTPRQKAVR